MTENGNQPINGKAVSYTAAGGYNVIKVVERSLRPPAANEVRIRVKAAGVNPTDTLLRSGGGGDGNSLVVPGMDAAGVIESLGPGVTRLHVVQEVMAAVMPRRPEGGAQAEYIVVPAASVVPIPEGTTLVEAATLPMNGLTAFGALEHAGLKPGQTFGVSGGAGLLAHYAIAAAKRHGLRVVADAKAEEVALVKGYGADVVVERGAGFVDGIRREFPDGVDALLDTALLGADSFGAIRDGGVYIPVRGWKEAPGERAIEIKPIYVNTVLERTDWLEELRDMVLKGEIKLRVAGEYPPEETADAQRAIEGGGLRGRPVIVF